MEKIERKIVCQHTEVGALSASVVLAEEVEVKKVQVMRNRLLRRKGSPFVDVALVRDEKDPSSFRLTAELGLYTPECCYFEGIGLFRNEVEKLLRAHYCIDCSLLHQPPPRRKPIPARKGK